MNLFRIKLYPVCIISNLLLTILNEIRKIIITVIIIIIVIIIPF